MKRGLLIILFLIIFTISACKEEITKRDLEKTEENCKIYQKEIEEYCGEQFAKEIKKVVGEKESNLSEDTFSMPLKCEEERMKEYFKETNREMITEFLAYCYSETDLYPQIKKAKSKIEEVAEESLKRTITEKECMDKSAKIIKKPAEQDYPCPTNPLHIFEGNVIEKEGFVCCLEIPSVD